MTATIYFPNDPSVGHFPANYTMELPFESFNDFGDDIEDSSRKELRSEIEELYKKWEGDTTNCHVTFSDEKQD